MAKSIILEKSKTPIGRYYFDKGGDFRTSPNYGFFLAIESIEHEGEESFWVPVKNALGEFLAYLKFARHDPGIIPYDADYFSSSDQSLFVLVEVRPVSCPARNLEAGCRSASILRPEET